MNEFGLAIAGSATGVALINKVSDAIGWYMAPRQTIRTAKAQAIAARIETEADIETADLVRRAAMRSVMEEITHQENLERIIEHALANLSDDASPQDISDDWVTHTLDKCRLVSDEDMRELWGRILAGEANTPGSFSRKTINLMDDLDKADAELFVNFCRFVVLIDGKAQPIISNLGHEIYSAFGVDVEAYLHLKSLGLIDAPGTTFAASLGPYGSDVFVQYFEETRRLIFPRERGNSLLMGNSMFTPSGQELYSVCSPSPVEGFFDYLTDEVWNTSWAGIEPGY